MEVSLKSQATATLQIGSSSCGKFYPSIGMVLKLYVILQAFKPQHLCFSDIGLLFILLVLAICESYLMGITHNVTDITLLRQLGSLCDLHLCWWPHGFVTLFLLPFGFPFLIP